MEADSMFKEMLELGGEEFEIQRGELTVSACGLRNRDKAGGRYVGFEAGTDIQPGDWLRGKVSADRFFVLDVNSMVIQGHVRQVKAYYETGQEHEVRLAQVEPPRTQYVGAIIHAMHGGNVQAIGHASQSEINQLINDPTALATALDDILAQVIDAVKADLPASQLIAYMQQAEEFKGALKSDKPQPAVLKRLLSTLAFLGDVEGTAGLVVRVWPLIGSLMPIALTVLQQAQLR